MPEPAEHAENRGRVETLLRKIPGFRGYLAKEDRRQSDQLQRQWLAERLERSKRLLDPVARSLADAGQIDAIGPIDRLRGRLDKLIGRIRGAVQGYSGFFDLVQVDEALLDRVYDFDIALLEHVDALSAVLERLAREPGQLNEILAEAGEKADTVGRQWDLREDMLAGLE